MIGFLLIVVAGSTVLLGEIGLNRHTTIAVSCGALVVCLCIFLPIVGLVSLRSVLAKDGLLRYSSANGLSQTQWGRSAARTATILSIIAVSSAGWCWYVTAVSAQYVSGPIVLVDGKVVEIFPNLTGRQSCRISLDIRVADGAIVHVCYVAGFLLAHKAISKTIPNNGQNVSIAVRTNWFGTVVDHLEY
jgi:hypothetical protein